MRRLLFAPVALAAVLLAVGAAGPGTTATEMTGDAAGVVTESRGGRSVPLANATVRITGGPVLLAARTDSQGRYRLADLVPGPYDITAAKPGYTPRTEARVAVTTGATAALDFALSWASRGSGGLEALVRTREGAPLAGASVALHRSHVFQSRLDTDELGSAVFPDLQDGSYSVEVTRPGFEPAASRTLLVAARQMTTQALTLTQDANQSGELGGSILDVNGIVARDAVVKIVAGLSGGQAAAGPDGRFRLDGLIPGAGYALQVTAPGFAGQTVGGIEVRLDPHSIQDFTLVPNASQKGSLIGRVQDAQGQGIAFATVRLSAGPAAGRQVLSGADGLYVFADLAPSDDYAVVAEMPGYSARGVSVVRILKGQSTVLDLEMQSQLTQPGSIGGKVREAAGGKALPDARVQVLNGPSAGLTTVTNGTGDYNIRGVVVGQAYTLLFTKSGFEPRTVPLVAVRMGVQTVLNGDLGRRSVTLGAIGGTVRKSDNTPLAGAKVTLFAGPSAPLEATTAADGTYLLRALRTGTGYALRAEKQGYAAGVRRGVTVADGETAVVDFTLPRGATAGTLRGVVVDLGQRPIPNAGVRFIAGPFRPDDARTDTRGQFVIQALPQGTYTLEIAAAGFITQQRPVVISPRRTTELAVQLLR